MNIAEFDQFLGGKKKANGFLLGFDDNLDIVSVEDALASVSMPAGQSLRVRRVPATNELEIVSDRIFIDELIVNEITENIDGANPVLTWLANSISSESGSTPYFFHRGHPWSQPGHLTRSVRHHDKRMARGRPQMRRGRFGYRDILSERRR
ncbi:MAG: hypothetical protein MZV63_62865 [Marinilabiliales bacterium]|nr:hypothetical protein [Marinilabiliales bacterium]